MSDLQAETEDFKPLKSEHRDWEFTKADPRSYWSDTWSVFRRNPLAVLAVCFTVCLFAGAIAAPQLSRYTYFQTQLELINRPPSLSFWFGTDDLGRDLFTRIWFGARISLSIGICAAILDLMIGVVWGSIAGYYGGKLDEFLMRLTDVLYAVPYLLKVIVVMVLIGSGVKSIVLAMALSGWINMARIVRGQILQLKNMEYVLAARSLGASSWRIVTRHLLPNIAGAIIVTMTLTIPTAIFVEAFLSFLGLGVQAPAASWGSMANDGLSAMRYYPWRLFFPAGFICITMLCFNIIGDGLRDALDPKTRI